MTCHLSSFARLSLTFLLQACVGSNVELPNLSAHKQPRSRDFATQDNTVKIPNRQKATLSKVVVPYSFPSVQLCEDHFERMQRAIDRDIGAYLGTDVDIVQKLIKNELRLDYRNRFTELQKSQDREVAVKKIMKLVQEAHFLALEVCAFLVDTSKCSSYNVRCVAASALDTLLKSFPTAASRDLLLRTMENRNEDVRHTAVTALRTLLALAPQLANGQTRDVLVKATRDKSSHVRQAAVFTLVGLVDAASRFAPDAYSVLLRVAKDESWRVRRATTSALVWLARVVHQYAPDARRAILNAVRDPHWRVRRAAVSMLGKFAKAFPQLANEAFRNVLLKATKDRDAVVRITAVSTLKLVEKIIEEAQEQ